MHGANLVQLGRDFLDRVTNACGVERLLGSLVGGFASVSVISAEAAFAAATHTYLHVALEFAIVVATGLAVRGQLVGPAKPFTHVSRELTLDTARASLPLVFLLIRFADFGFLAP